MSKFFSSLGGNAGAVLAGAGMAMALGLGAFIGFGRDAAEPVDVALTPPPSTPAQAQPEQTAEVQPDSEVEAEKAAPAPQVVAVPSFDELRREAGGTTIIAGRAEPLSDVEILVDGEQVATTTADNTGGFAAITSLPAQGTAQVVTLSSRSGDDIAISTDEIILAPAALPEEPEPDVQAVVQAEQTSPAALSETLAQTAPEQVAPQQTAPEELAPEQTAPEQIVAEQITPEQIAPEQITPEQIAPEPPRVAVLKSDEEGVSLLNPAQTDVMTAVALDTIGYSELGEVQLTGRAQADTAKVRIYLDNRSVISLPVGADGRWRGDLPNVDEGVYTLRVDELDAAGTVSSRVETPFKRESADTLAQASADNDGPVKSITVQTGATLWAIARDRYGDGTLFVRVFEANTDSIRDPDLIYPGQVFDLPN